MSGNRMEELAAQVVERALGRGADEAECTIGEGDEFSVNVRLREVESLKEAGYRGAGVRVLVGRRSGSAYTSELSDAGLERMVDAALELAAITSEDPHAGLPEPDELGRVDADLRLYSDDVAALETEFKIAQARQAEQAALGFDPRIRNSEGASFESRVGLQAFANSRGWRWTATRWNAITGSRRRGASGAWRSPPRWGGSPPSGLCDAWAPGR